MTPEQLAEMQRIVDRPLGGTPSAGMWHPAVERFVRASPQQWLRFDPAWRVWRDPRYLKSPYTTPLRIFDLEKFT